MASIAISRIRLFSILRVVAAFILLLGVTARFTAASADPVDLTVTSVEVTQGIQTTTNSIPLVARRSTAVRATIGVAGASSPVSGVTGRLHVFVGGGEVTPTAGLSPINAPFTAPLAPQRQNENDTLNFELISPTSISASTDVDFRVDITPVTGESNTANNSGSANNLTAVTVTTPHIFYTRVNYTPSGLGLPSNSMVQPGVGDAFVRGIYPVDDSDPVLYREGLFPTLPFSQDTDGDGKLDDDGDADALKSLLESCRQLIVMSGLGASSNTFLYGWVAGNPFVGAPTSTGYSQTLQYNGTSRLPGFVATGNTDPVRYQRTFAHELDHNFGDVHNTRLLDQVGWDVGARLPNNPSTNNITGRVKPMTLADIMKAGLLSNQAWIDTITYSQLLSSPILASPLRAPGLSAAPKFARRVAVIQGIFDSSGKRLVSLKPVFRFPWLAQPSALAEEGPFIAQIQTDGGLVISTPFTAGNAEDTSKAVEKFGAFSLMVRVPRKQEIASLQITDGTQVVASLERTAPPKIEVVGPDPGSRIKGKVRIVWKAVDKDSQPADLMYQVAYSWNSGRSWVPLAVDIAGNQNSVVVNTDRLKRSRGEAMIRVFVSDGLNTEFADVGGLTK